MRKVCEMGGVCGGKTGLTLGIRNGWRDFRFREKFLEREEIRKRFQVENAGFRGVQGWKGAAKFGLLRLDSGVGMGTCTEERKETWRQSERKWGENARKEVGKVDIAEMVREEREWGKGKRERRGHEKSRTRKGSAWVGEGLGLSVGIVDRQSQPAKRQQGEGERSVPCKA